MTDESIIEGYPRDAPASWFKDPAHKLREAFARYADRLPTAGLFDGYDEFGSAIALIGDIRTPEEVASERAFDTKYAEATEELYPTYGIVNRIPEDGV